MSTTLKYHFAQIPIVKIFIPFLLGITLGLYNSSIPLVLSAVVIVFILITIGSILFFKKKLKNVLQRKYVASLIIACCILLLGFSISSLHRQNLQNHHFSNHLQEYSNIAIQITAPVTEKERSVKIVGTVFQIAKDDSLFKTKGKLLLYLQKSEQALALEYGDVLYINTRINEISPPLNPHQFDYKTYLRYQNIYHQAYADSTHWQITTTNNGNSVIASIFDLRNYFKNTIAQYIEGENEKAVAQAILIGNKDRLDAELIRSYSSSGAMHVLAVSGLHVGIIYLVFNFLLSFLDKNAKTRKLKPILLILLIWFYAVLTGASPSVLRAATMFSFITIGTSLQRHTNIYNVISASALILTLFNPFIITEVGFQLSYFAVIGIIFLQPKIYRIFVAKNWLLDKIWALTAVSISAQIATFPLGILYFHQFPNLFWLSNLLVIPAATLILYIGVLLLAFSWWKWLAIWIGFLLEKIIWLLNLFVAWIDAIPFALSSGMDISHFQTLLIYTFIIAFSLAFVFRQKRMLYLGFSVLLIFSISFAAKMYQVQDQKQLIVYSVPNTSALEIINGNTRYSQFDSTLLNDDKQLLFSVKHNWWNKHIKQEADFEEFSFTTKDENSFIHFEGKNILLIDSNYTLPSILFETDYAIISHNPKLYLDNFTAKIKAEKFIFDSSNPQWKIKYWKADCDSLGLDCYFVTDNFAYVEEF